MTLVGLLPPLCDNGSMLVDGGYRERSFRLTARLALNPVTVDNLPVIQGINILPQGSFFL